MIKEKKAAEQRAKEDRIRTEAREKAARERDEEAKRKKVREEEERKAKKEGGMWIETGSGKKGKSRKSGGGGSPVTPTMGAKGMLGVKEKKENVRMERVSPKKERAGDGGGRAGTWGPKKILSRKENVGGVLGEVVNGVNSVGGPNGGGEVGDVATNGTAKSTPPVKT